MRTARDHFSPICDRPTRHSPAAQLSRRLLAGIVAALLVLAPASHAFARFSALIMDAQSGQILYAGNADMPRYPASLTKMMTLYMLFEALESGRVGASDAITFSPHACAQPPSKLGLRPGQSLSVEDAILALVTKSANDVAAAVAEHLSGTEYRFGLAMTERAHALGMTQSTFRNASGLPDPEQSTTARDMATLAYALLRDFPQYYHYFGTRVFYYGRAAHANHNRMLNQYDGIDGIKTGYIRASGFNLVASATRNGRRLIGVVFGARSPGERGRIMASLLDNGFGGAPSDSYEVLVARNLTQPGAPDRGAGEAAGDDDEDGGRIVAARTGASRSASSFSSSSSAPAAVRLGAFRDRGGAAIAARDAQRRLGQAAAAGTIEISQIRRKGRRGGTVYLASIAGLEREDAARACSALRSSHRSACSVVMPRSGGETRTAASTRRPATIQPARDTLKATTPRPAAGPKFKPGRPASPVVAAKVAGNGRAASAKPIKVAGAAVAASIPGRRSVAPPPRDLRATKSFVTTAKATKTRTGKAVGDGKIQVQQLEKKKREALNRTRGGGVG
jgi:D-alanyl-D-alanine carboxypeptidase